MDKERELYNKFVNVLINSLDMNKPDTKILNVIMNFLKNQNIQASENNGGLRELKERISCLPFPVDDV